MAALSAKLTDFDRRYIAMSESSPSYMIVPSWGESEEARAILEKIQRRKFEEEVEAERRARRYDTEEEEEE